MRDKNMLSVNVKQSLETGSNLYASATYMRRYTVSIDYQYQGVTCPNNLNFLPTIVATDNRFDCTSGLRLHARMYVFPYTASKIST